MGTDEPDLDRFDVRLAAEGDAVAFERIYRRHAARIHSLARRLLGPSRADDATQEIFLRAWKKLPSYRAEGAFGGWLYTLARNWLLGEVGRHRGAATEVGLDGTGEEPSVDPVEPGPAVDLDAALRRLPEGARKVVALRHFAGCTHQEIAGHLGISVGTSKSQLHRARRLLRDMLEPPEPPRKASR